MTSIYNSVGIRHLQPYYAWHVLQVVLIKPSSNFIKFFVCEFLGSVSPSLHFNFGSKYVSYVVLRPLIYLGRAALQGPAGYVLQIYLICSLCGYRCEMCRFISSVQNNRTVHPETESSFNPAHEDQSHIYTYTSYVNASWGHVNQRHAFEYTLCWK